MRILVDENIPKGITDWLRSTGHDVLVAAETQPGIPDASWLAIAERDQRCILTSDKDFGELVFRDGLASQGVLLLRLDDLLPAEMLSRLQDTWSVVEANSDRQFIVITPTKVRVRPLPSPP